MTARIDAVFQGGVFWPLQPLDIAEGERVQLTITSTGHERVDPAADLSDLEVDTGISDLATNIDHYLYGLPKQEE